MGQAFHAMMDWSHEFQFSCVQDMCPDHFHIVCVGNLVLASQGSPIVTALVGTILVKVPWIDPTSVTHPYMGQCTYNTLWNLGRRNPVSTALEFLHICRINTMPALPVTGSLCLWMGQAAIGMMPWLRCLSDTTQNSEEEMSLCRHSITQHSSLSSSSQHAFCSPFCSVPYALKDVNYTSIYEEMHAPDCPF